MKSLAELAAIKEKMQSKVVLREGSGDIRVVVGMATCGIAAGARPVLNAFVEEVGKADLAGKIVGVQKDSSALAALQDEENQENLDLAASFADLIQYADYNTGFMDLESGAINALAIDIGVAAYQISSRGDAYVMLDENLSSEQYGIGFLKGNEELKNQVEETLMEMVEDGTFMKIAEKYSDFGLVDSVCLGK